MKKYSFAFIVHSRNRSDLPRKFPILRFLPKTIFDFLTLHLPPFHVSEITGLVHKDGTALTGTLIGIPMTAHQLLEHRDLAKKRIIDAVHLAEKHGAKHIGLGAMTASLSAGGQHAVEHATHACLTTGRTFTVKNIVSYIEFVTERFHLNTRSIRIGIVGAAGGIGFGTAAELARRGYKKFALIDLERKLDRVQSRLQSEQPSGDLELEITHQFSVLATCDIVVAATSAPEAVIASSDIASGTIIINDAQPSDISPEIVHNRPDVLVIEGGVLRSKDINCHLHMGLADKHDIFSCLAEVLLLTASDNKTCRLFGEVDPSLYTQFDEIGASLGFRPSLQNDAGVISEERLSSFAEIIAVRQAQSL